MQNIARATYNSGYPKKIFIIMENKIQQRRHKSSPTGPILNDLNEHQRPKGYKYRT
jgi:hypothetical protein